ncbi:MAG: hypothetical protein AB8B65_06360, partial [Kordia sp.]|uniref:hypothetical protein n=1 Tax=Kordia sp. TaxID=1965332 RepID=UPI00385B0AF5
KYRGYIKEYEEVSDEILNTYKARICEVYKEKKAVLDPEKFIIIGENEPIKASELLDNENTKKVLSGVFSIDSKTNLGTFEVPGDGEQVNFYVQKSDIEEDEDLTKLKTTKKYLKDSNDTRLVTVKSAIDTSFRFTETPKTAKFKSIQIELLEGGIVDARLILESNDGKTHFYFEGTDPVSILNYSRKASKRAIFHYSHYVSLQGEQVYNEETLKMLLVKYTDVLDYHPNAGSNYVPDDVSYKFPSDKQEEANIKDRRSYQVINNNNLQHVLDLRTYTDLLGLFGDEANGLFQIEGKADFFINPFNPSRTALYIFKKISPYVRYSRFDDDNDFIQAVEPDMDNTNPNTGDPAEFYYFNDQKLSLLERSNLEMGLDVDIINFRIAKELPFWTSLYFPLSYNVTKVRTNTAELDGAEVANEENFKMLGYGLGANLEIRRFNNFGLNLGYELKGYSFIGDYARAGLSEPNYLKTQAVKAEIFYYPGTDRSNSIFLRMKSIRDVSATGDDSFFQLQVGYRFTIGVGAIKAK